MEDREGKKMRRG